MDYLDNYIPSDAICLAGWMDRVEHITNLTSRGYTTRAAPYIGAIAFIHRFGSSLNGHVHFHACAVDVVFEQVTLCDWTTLEQPPVVDW